MLKQDYIEKIAAYIVEGWNAADAGDRQACSIAKRRALNIAQEAAEALAIRPVIGSLSHNSERQTCIRSHCRGDAAISIWRAPLLVDGLNQEWAERCGWSYGMFCIPIRRTVLDRCWYSKNIIW